MKQRINSFRIVLLLACVLGTNAVADVVKVTRQVLLPDGKPAVGAKVLIRVPKVDGTWQEMRLLTDAEGMYETVLNLPTRSKETPSLPHVRYLIVDVAGSALSYSSLGKRPISAELRQHRL